ncbi:MAG: class I SAM-dependent methyltransferase [Dehalococcoidia bacterium]|nr:class I SAM-dependent methyltransferase [Dehalococcoidia bacterium]
MPIHVASEMYDVPAFKAGRSTLNQTELEELGEVRGKTLLHLQCHFGLDTLSWAREGAIVTGVDFSEPAIETAHGLAAALGIEARFLMSNIYDLPANLDGQFDIVFTSYGVLIWLPDVTRWAEIAASFVRPGGTFYIAEFHPFAGVFDGAKDVDDLRVRNPYFPTEKPLRFEDIGTYTDRGGKLQNSVTYEWAHPVSDVVTALVDAGLRIEFFHEFPYTPWSYLPFKEHAGDGMFRLAKHDGCVPLVYSIKATKPETS